MLTAENFAPYTNSDITRNNPTCFLFVIDQSSSMAAKFGWRQDEANRGMVGIPKADAVANALNSLLQNLIITCSKSDGIRNYFSVGVIGYGATVGSAWTGALLGHELVPISTVAENYARMVETQVTEKDPGGQEYSRAVLYPVWVEPRAGGSTPMCAALRMAYDILNPWCLRNATCHPPVVVHITDGEATDGDPAPLMDSLRSLSTANGMTTLFNVHLSSSREAVPRSFPDSPEDLPDDYARLLYDGASPLTPHMRRVAWDNGMPLGEHAKAFVLNADPSLMVLALEIGTRPGSVW